MCFKRRGHWLYCNTSFTWTTHACFVSCSHELGLCACQPSGLPRAVQEEQRQFLSRQGNCRVAIVKKFVQVEIQANFGLGVVPDPVDLLLSVQVHVHLELLELATCKFQHSSIQWGGILCQKTKAVETKYVAIAQRLRISNFPGIATRGFNSSQKMSLARTSFVAIWLEICCKGRDEAQRLPPYTMIQYDTIVDVSARKYPKNSKDPFTLWWFEATHCQDSFATPAVEAKMLSLNVFCVLCL